MVFYYASEINKCKMCPLSFKQNIHLQEFSIKHMETQQVIDELSGRHNYSRMDKALYHSRDAMKK